jgi:hypothetical protein
MKTARMVGSHFTGWARVLGAALAAAWLFGCDYTDWGDGDGSVREADAGGEASAPANAPVKADMVDLLFVIDNSGSMKEEQAKLRDQIPRLLTILTSGDLDPEDDGGVPEKDKDFRAARDLHLGVVSADMGTPGVQMSIDPEQKCQVGFGDNGLFQHAANPAGDPDLIYRSAVYPLFLSYQQGQDVDALASDLQCISALGTGGCGFEMQLEAALKALWPADEKNLTDEQKDLDLAFLLDDPPHGDREHLNFLRGTPYHPSQPDLLSVLAIVLLTDEEDCSAGARGNVDFLEHPNTAPPGIGDQCACLRCYYDTLNNTGYRYTVDRYIEAFRLLRPGNEQRIVFAAITGVPPSDPAEADFDDNGDGTLDDEESQAFFQAVLDHPLMQNRIRADGMNLEPSCTLANPDWDGVDPETQYVTKAYPPRRITEVARGFGENGVVESICQEDFSGAVDRIIRAISRHLGS